MFPRALTAPGRPATSTPATIFKLPFFLLPAFRPPTIITAPTTRVHLSSLYTRSPASTPASASSSHQRGNGKAKRRKTTSLHQVSQRSRLNVQTRTYSTRGSESFSRTMASPFKIYISPENTGLLKVKQTEEAAEKASSLLQEDLEKHHVFFNEDGFHNHIPHHILALYGTGASPSALQKGYDENTAYQRPVLPTHKEVLTSMFESWEHARPCLGKEKHYSDFLRFFQEEMAKAGADSPSAGDEGYLKWEEIILNKYLFPQPGSTVGDDLFLRLFSGLLHPLIQLMYGVEWNQPSIVAEGLAQAAVHGDEIGVYFLEAEKLASSSQSPNSGVQAGEGSTTIISLLEEASKNQKLASAAGPQNRIQIRDGILKKEDVLKEMVRLAAKVRVSPEEKEIERRTVEMFDACLLVASSAALFKEGVKVPKFDFYLIHNVNSSPIFPTLNSKPWLSLQSKARLLEWKIRMDLLQYVARGCPPLSADKISRYEPKTKPDLKSGAEVVDDGLEVISRLHDLEDDGHAIKLGRAALICREMTLSLLHPRVHGDKVKENEESKKDLAINTPELWDKILHLIVDSVEAPGPTWVRNGGLEGAWEEVPDAPSDSGDSHKL